MVDIYSLGCLFYEMLVGIPPHYSSDRLEMYNKKINKDVIVPNFINRDARDLLKRLLERDP